MSKRRPRRLPPADRERLVQLSCLLAEQRGRIRWVDYRLAEQDCDRLGALLIREIGRRELEKFAFHPIPRGGLMVLGMLSYLLDLPIGCLAPGDPGRPVVVVDDCALTGARFRSALAASSAPEVVFAHLYSPAALRAAIEAAENRVRRCLAVHDLTDRASELPAAERRAWRQRWRRRLGPDRYFYGKIDPVIFPWTEPDRPLWNRATGALEVGWRLAPAGDCLRNRGRLGPPPTERPSQRWRVSPFVAVGESSGGLLLCDTAGGQVVSLEATAAEIWRRLARHGDPRIAAAEIASSYDVALDVARADVDDLVADLEARGLLEPVHENA